MYREHGERSYRPETVDQGKARMRRWWRKRIGYHLYRFDGPGLGGTRRWHAATLALGPPASHRWGTSFLVDHVPYLRALELMSKGVLGGR